MALNEFLTFLPPLMIVFGGALIAFGLWSLLRELTCRRKGAAMEEFEVAPDDMDNLKEPMTHLLRGGDPKQSFMVDLGSKTPKPGDKVKLLYLEGQQPLMPHTFQHVYTMLIGLALLLMAVLELAGLIRVL